MTSQSIRLAAVCAIALAVSLVQVVDLSSAAPQARAGSAAATTAIGTAGRLVFPSGIAGTSGDALTQVEDVVTRLHHTLAGRGLGVGHMLQHTIYLKEGAADPLMILQRFHETATRLSPSLKKYPSVGMFVRVTAFPDPRTLVMLDAVAGVPTPRTAVETFARVPFIVGPTEIVESIRVEPLMFTAGFDTRDADHPTPPPGLETQIDAMVGRLDAAMKRAGLSVANMVSHNLYVKKGTSPGDIIRLLHPALRRYTPSLTKYPSVGAIIVVENLEDSRSLVELDAIAATGDTASYARVPLAEVTMDVVRSVKVGGIVLLSSMPGIDFENQSATPADVLSQVDIAAKNVHHSLQKSGLSIANMVKYKLYLRNGAGDPAAVHARFLEAARRYAPDLATRSIASTVVLVDALASNERLFEASVIAAR